MIGSIKNMWIMLNCSLIIFSCQQKMVETEVQEDTKVDINSVSLQLEGKWSNLSMKVIVKKDEGDSIIDVSSKTWESVLGIKPIVTEFKKDGNFISTYYSLEGDMINESVGSWEMVGDSLIMTQEDQASYYYVKVTGMEATFIGYLDWDGDSIKDDLYSGVQQKLMIE